MNPELRPTKPATELEDPQTRRRFSWTAPCTAHPNIVVGSSKFAMLAIIVAVKCNTWVDGRKYFGRVCDCGLIRAIDQRLDA